MKKKPRLGGFGLGKLLLQGLKRKSVRRLARGAATPVKTKRLRVTVNARDTTPPRVSTPIRKTRVKPPVAPETRVPSLAEASPVQVIAQTSPAGPTTDSLRPNERLRKCIEAFLLDQRSEHTRRAYEKDLKRFMRFLSVRRYHQGPEQLTRHLVIAYKDSLLGEKLEHTTIDRHLATLRSFFRWLVDDEYLAKNPAEGVRFLNPRRVSRTIGFADVEVVRVLAKPNLHTRTGAQHYAILMILFYCGLRRSELCSLRTSSIGEERGHAVLRLRGKGNAERVIAMPPAVKNALHHYFLITGKSRTKDAPLFSPIRNNRTGVKDKALDPSMIFYIVTRYAKEAGIANRVSPHSCRATAISNARDHHVPDRAIQEFAGWASPDMITRYDKRKTSVEKSASHAISYGSSPRTLPSVPKPQE